jgi:iron complex transport system substrate-binding protein
MSVFVRRSDPHILAAVTALLIWGGAAMADAPKRVVSINLCTDQLAMMLAAPGQLVSVSYLARDRRSSAMADLADGYPVNRGLAEDVFLLKPDLVLTGDYTTPATVAMLERLGVRVERFSLATDFDQIADRLRQMGRALGREAMGAAAAARFEADVAALQSDAAQRTARRAALYYANGYTSGDDTLAGHILAAAGLANIASELGMPAGGSLALETLVMAEPDALITAERFEGHSRSEDILDHGVLRRVAESAARSTTNANWVCGTPHVLSAIEGLRE